ncbi:MAG: hypothetical protein GTO24_24860 [candidate division Zixibacteria bacterium]|nr:hypothetical protein [candidate division Zixibacteria bacterium]
MSLFRNTSGRTGEDIATEVISYMLDQQQAYIPFQKLFFNRLFQKPCSSDELGVETTTQPSFEDGRPDLIILTGNSMIVVETKLGAYLSGDDQLTRYCGIFQNENVLRRYFPGLELDTITDKRLAMLAPSKTIERSVEATDRRCKHEFGKDFLQWCREQGIKFVRLPWEDVLTDLDVRNSLQHELALFVRDFINQELNEDEKMILKDKNVPAGLRKVINTIGDIRDHLGAQGFTTGRMSQSYKYYGFEVKTPAFTSWFGYFFTIWEKYGTPVFLQIQENLIKKEKDEILKKLRGKGFEKDEQEQFVRPFAVDSVDSWKQDLIHLLLQLSGREGIAEKPARTDE